jgi:hypothetical protein
LRIASEELRVTSEELRITSVEFLVEFEVLVHACQIELVEMQTETIGRTSCQAYLITCSR